MEDQIPKREEPRYYFSQVEVDVIELGLKKILDEYDSDLVALNSQLRLPEALSRLLEIVLTLTELYAETYRYSNVNHASYKPASQLQMLKDELVRTQSRELIDITFKIPRKSFKVDDPKVSKWIRDQLIKAFDEFDIPGEFGEAMFLLDSKDNPLKNPDKRDLLKSYGNRPMSFAKAVYLFCDDLITNLKDIFTLTPHDAKYLSEVQISFLYEVLALIGFDTFTSAYIDGRPISTERDRLYSMLHLQQRVKR